MTRLPTKYAVGAGDLFVAGIVAAGTWCRTSNLGFSIFAAVTFAVLGLFWLLVYIAHQRFPTEPEDPGRQP
jgi:hypothetical protein